MHNQEANEERPAANSFEIALRWGLGGAHHECTGCSGDPTLASASLRMFSTLCSRLDMRALSGWATPVASKAMPPLAATRADAQSSAGQQAAALNAEACDVGHTARAG